MNTDKNSYTIVYSIIMVVVAAVLLAGAAVVLKPAQSENLRIDKMSQILRSVGKSAESSSEIPALYKQTIKQSLLVDTEGKVHEIFEGEAIGTDADKAFKADKLEGLLPVYIAELEGGKSAYILPLDGKGLWDKIWGFIAIDAQDHSTVVGVDFGNKGETPGLGAEMSTPEFASRFTKEKKEIFKNGTFTGLAVVKKGTKIEGQDYVDGISGGTLTSDGIHNMLKKDLGNYQRLLETYNTNAE